MKILIVGSNSFVGQKVALAQIASFPDNNLFLCSLGNNRLSSLPVPFYRADITDKPSLAKVFDEVQPDVVINTAAIASPDACEQNKDLALRINVQGAATTAELATLYDAHLVHLSTDFVFNGCKPFLTEDDVPDPVNYYGFTKLESERVVSAYASSYAIVRTVSVYGYLASLTRLNFILRVQQALENKKEYRVPNDQFRTPTLVEDLAKAILVIGTNRIEGLFHISGEEGLTNYEFGRRVATIFGLDEGLLIPVSTAELEEKAARPLNTGFSIAKARQVFGFKPMDTNEGLLFVKRQMAKEF
ncbi:MAG TPA: SDR family oxidoreductase [Williamwhitmania sp.]|nr:SDR family oxidoreductase [Williamwhitmania sp.]